MTASTRELLRQWGIALAMAAAVSAVALCANRAHAEVIGGPPAGCPRVAFCACAMSVEVFGHPIRSLWPARAWYRFQRVHARPYAVGVRPHHVLQLRQHIAGTRWLVFDPNSGGHKSRIHERDVRGYVFVDPTATAAVAVIPAAGELR